MPGNMTTREIQGHLMELYAVDVPPTLISPEGVADSRAGKMVMREAVGSTRNYLEEVQARASARNGTGERATEP
jgi:transposase-like protein